MGRLAASRRSWRSGALCTPLASREQSANAERLHYNSGRTTRLLVSDGKVKEIVLSLQFPKYLSLSRTSGFV